MVFFTLIPSSVVCNQHWQACLFSGPLVVAILFCFSLSCHCCYCYLVPQVFIVVFPHSQLGGSPSNVIWFWLTNVWQLSKWLAYGVQAKR